MIFIVVFIILTGPTLTFLSLRYGEMNTIDFMVSITSISIAFIALIVALSTYFSIDSVNNITKMEGNILENEDYSTSIAEIVRKYDQKTADETAEAVFNDLENRFSKRNSNTAVKLANNLQTFIDIIVIFPSLFDTQNKKHESNMERMQSLLNQIDKRINSILTVSVGNLTLSEETQKLIKAIIYYQKLATTHNLRPVAELLEVKGSIIKNSVTRTVYYNYVGLFSLKKVFQEVQNQLHVHDVNEIETIEYIIENKSTLSRKSLEIISIYLQEAESSFEHANENSLNDFMWQSFIKYNQARVYFWKQHLLGSETEETWVECMNDAIYARKRLSLFIDDIVDGKETYLKDHFLYQEYIASLVNFNYAIASKEDISDPYHDYTYPSYTGLVDHTYIREDFTMPFSRIARYQERIRERVSFTLVGK